MGSNKKDLEIIYNLQWKNGNGTGHGDKSNIVGMYDIPATTLNWETFKSYLLKNSGAMVDDVKVSYVSSDEKEFPIESQLDFQIALYSFRQRARNSDVITLKLDRIWETKTSRIKRQRQQVEECVAAVPSVEEVPDWFKDFMKVYKKEIIDEVTASVVTAMSNMKPPPAAAKLKETKKRTRKVGEAEKEVRKTKLERKIEELEEKTNKIKEKKLALTRSIENQPFTSAALTAESDMIMDATPVGSAEVTVSHMIGGELYRHEWFVTNTGQAPWTRETELRYAWGSEALKPIESIIECPLLMPGENGSVVVFLEVPTTPGEYECYFHFCHKGQRFGQWLGCHVIVDATPIKLLSMHRFNPVEKVLIVEPPSAVSWSAQSEKPLNLTKEVDIPVAKVSETLDDLTIACSDSDNLSVVSIAGSNSSVHTTHSDEFVVVPIDTESEIETTKAAGSRKCGYAYVNIEGKKQAVPKVLLRDDYLETAEEATIPELAENDDSKRLFVFPLNCPGFEVVYPPNPMTESVIQSADNLKVETKPLVTEQVIEHLETDDQCISNKTATALMLNHAFCTKPLSVLVPDTATLPESTVATAPQPPTSPAAAPPIVQPTITSVPQLSTNPTPPTFAYPNLFQSSPNNNSAWFYSGFPTAASTTTPPQFASSVPQAPLNPSYTYAYLNPFVQPPADAWTAVPQSGQHFESDERPTSPTAQQPPPPAVHVIPDVLLSGAVNVASSAINTARSVLNMFASAPPPQATPQSTPQHQATPQPTPQEGTQFDLQREQALNTLNEMGFWNRTLNATLLERFHGDIGRVVAELVH